MSMTDNASAAFRRLQQRGVAVRMRDTDANEPTDVQFYLIHASYEGTEQFADDSGHWIKEAWVNGHWINPMGIRHDVHEIFAEHNLAHAWETLGRVCVYDASVGEVAGWLHKDCDKRELEAVRQRAINGRRSAEVDPPPMSDRGFNVFRELARIGAPVWDWHNCSHSHNPTLLPAGTQFVMKCEPKYAIYFADSIDGVEKYFEETDGLRPDVHHIVKRNGLSHLPFVHRYDAPRFPHVALVAFFDADAEPLERGA